TTRVIGNAKGARTAAQRVARGIEHRPLDQDATRHGVERRSRPARWGKQPDDQNRYDRHESLNLETNSSQTVTHSTPPPLAGAVFRNPRGSDRVLTACYYKKDERVARHRGSVEAAIGKYRASWPLQYAVVHTVGNWSPPIAIWGRCNCSATMTPDHSSKEEA